MVIIDIDTCLFLSQAKIVYSSRFDLFLIKPDIISALADPVEDLLPFTEPLKCKTLNQCRFQS